jgi:glycosyltransferase involved in cell wall biosynthesis
LRNWNYPCEFISNLMKLAFLTTDNREPYRQYARAEPWFGTAPEAVLQGLANIPDLEVHVVSCAQQPMKSSPAKLAENIYFHSLHVPKWGWMRTLYQGCVRATRRKLHELSPDMVHGQGTERDCSISAVLSGFPAVITIHGNMAALAREFHARPGSFSWLAARLEDWTLPRAEGVLCNSDYTEALVRPRHATTWRVANPLRETFFSAPAARAPKKDGTVHLINIGMVTPRKRQMEILSVCRDLRLKGHPIHMEFIGAAMEDDTYGAAFLREMARPSVAEYASFSGFHGTEALIARLDRADACVHFPSEESFGLVVAEALARNLKFFGSRAGGIVDIAESIEGAELFALGDWTGLENAIARWVERGAPRPISAAQTMRERYYPDVIARRHLDIYEQILRDGSRGRQRARS